MIFKKLKSNKVLFLTLVAILFTAGVLMINSRSFVSANQNCGYNWYKTGNFTTSDVCNISSGYEGLALGNLTVSPGGQVTVAADATLVLSPNYTVNFTSGNTTGKVNVIQPRAGTPPGRPAIVHGSLCSPDADGDGYADKVTLYSGQYEPTWPTYAANNDACPAFYTKRQNLADLPGGAWQLDCVPSNPSLQKLDCVPSAHTDGSWVNVGSCGTFTAGKQRQSKTWTANRASLLDCGGNDCTLSDTNIQDVPCGNCVPPAQTTNYCGSGACARSQVVNCTAGGEWPTDCTPGTAETDAEFCFRWGKNCGSYTNTDNCNASRTANCGSSCTYCNSNVCGSCTNGSTRTHTPATCGSGACTANYSLDTCVNGAWSLGSCLPGTAETDSAYCTRNGKNCGSYIGTDNCLAARTANCGSSCTYCNSNVCGACTLNSTAACDGNADTYSCGIKTCGGSPTSWGSCLGDPGVAWYYRDADVDGYGDPNTAIYDCAGKSISGYVNNSYDCNDSSAGVTTSGTRSHNPASCGSGACTVAWNDTCSNGVWTGGSCTPLTAETNAAFCTRYGKNCGSYTNTDNCNASRTANCGTVIGTERHMCFNNVDTDACVWPYNPTDNDGDGFDDNQDLDCGGGGACLTGSCCDIPTAHKRSYGYTCSTPNATANSCSATVYVCDGSSATNCNVGSTVYAPSTYVFTGSGINTAVATCTNNCDSALLCSSGNVVKDARGCNGSGSCGTWANQCLVQTCTSGCTNGVCNTACTPQSCQPDMCLYQPNYVAPCLPEGTETWNQYCLCAGGQTCVNIDPWPNGHARGVCQTELGDCTPSCNPLKNCGSDGCGGFCGGYSGGCGANIKLCCNSSQQCQAVPCTAPYAPTPG